MSEFGNYSVCNETTKRHSLHLNLGPNQFLKKSLNAIIEVVDLVFSGNEFELILNSITQTF